VSIRSRDLVGRTITHVDLQGYWSGEGRHRKWMTDPVFTLDNGRKLYFIVHEDNDGGDYGIEATLTKGGTRRTEKPS
jgi:hypothetical protein